MIWQEANLGYLDGGMQLGGVDMEPGKAHMEAYLQAGDTGRSNVCEVIASGACLHTARRHEAYPQEVPDGLCNWCQAAPDTEWHANWGCMVLERSEIDGIKKSHHLKDRATIETGMTPSSGKRLCHVTG